MSKRVRPCGVGGANGADSAVTAYDRANEDADGRSASIADEMLNEVAALLAAKGIARDQPIVSRCLSGALTTQEVAWAVTLVLLRKADN